jgi:DNA replication protein DnaC
MAAECEKVAARSARENVDHLGFLLQLSELELLDRGRRLKAALATLLLEAHEERQLASLRSQLAKLDLLVLDELGYVPASKFGAELLFDVISTAYERASVIVTTNLPFEEWKEVLGSERLSGATLDRRTHRCTIVETGRESYRLREAQTRRRSGAANRPPSAIDAGPIAE